MKKTKLFKWIFSIALLGTMTVLGCKQENETKAEQENSADATAMDAALQNMFVYHDSVRQDVHHAQHMLHHHDSIYHHHDSMYNHHHDHYHHGDTAHHHQGFHHTAKQHHQHDSLAFEHHKLVH